MTRRKGEKGAVLPLVALALVVIVLLVGLAVDLGHVHNVKVELQRAVDAAALAGAQRLLPDDATNATVAAAATARANTVDATLIGVLIDDGDPDADPPVPASMPPLVITPGQWDTENLTLADRFAEDVTPYNAVQVTATMTVEHFFFYPFDPTVGADAIAIKKPDTLTIPLAIISCIPPTGEIEGELNVCGIETYTFSGPTSKTSRNSAGWTSLTIGAPGGASQQEIASFFDPATGADLFISVVELLDATNNQPPFSIDNITRSYDDAYLGCEGNAGESINCGLGGEFNNYVSSGASSDDPLVRYAQSLTDALPRLITTNDNEQAAFRDILFQDGSLLYDEDGETLAAYQARLGRLYNGTGIEKSTVAAGEPYDYDGSKVNPDRFQPGPDYDRFITTNKGGDYTPNLNRVLNYAGYPPVWSTTGNMGPVMDALLDKAAAGSGAQGAGDYQFTAPSSTWPPFDGNIYDATGVQGFGNSLKFVIPVIFAGSCDTFDPKSHAGTNTSHVQEQNELHYVGLASILVTRILDGNQCFSVDDPVEADDYPYSGECPNPIDWEPLGLDTNLLFECPEQNNPGGSIEIEGIVRPPLLGGDQGGVPSKILLVK